MLSNNTHISDLIEAINVDDEKRVREILDIDPSLLNTGLDSFSQSPLHKACERKSLKMIQSLLTYKEININQESDVSTNTLFLFIYSLFESHVRMEVLLYT